jgi:WD40 repeat protein
MVSAALIFNCGCPRPHAEVNQTVDGKLETGDDLNSTVLPSAKRELALNCAGGPTSLAFSPDSNFLAVGVAGDDESNASLVSIYSTTDWSKQRDIEFKDVIPDVCFSPDGTKLAACGFNGHVCVWLVSDSSIVCEFARGTPLSVALSFSRDSQQIAVSGTNDATLISATTGEKIRSWHVDDGLVYGLAFSPTSDVVATCGHLHAFALWNSTDGKNVRTVSVGQGTLISFSPSGQRIAANYLPQRDLGGGRKILSSRSVLLIADGRTGTKIHSVPFEMESLSALAFTADGRFLALGSQYSKLEFFNVETGKLVGNVSVATEGVTAIALSLDGRWMATASEHGTTVEIWKLSTN